MTILDQIGQLVTVHQPPQRIISCVPSITELLAELQLQDEVIGLTKFCVHPRHWFATKNRIGGTKSLNINKITSLKPDLILANKEENTKSEINILSTQFPVYVSDVSDIDTCIEMIHTIGKLCFRERQSEDLVQNIFAKRKKFRLKTYPQKAAAYFIWKDPYMVAGGGTFINSMLVEAGFQNIFAKKTRYPEIKLAELPLENLDVLLFSSEPFPFKQKHIMEVKHYLFGLGKIHIPHMEIVNGEMFSWYGSRILRAFPYLSTLRKSI